MIFVKVTSLLVLLSITISLSFYFPFITPLFTTIVAFYSFYLKFKINKMIESSKNLEDTIAKLKTDVSTLFDNQKHLLLINNSLRARINNYYGKTSKKQEPSIIERLKDIERREKELSEE